MSEANRSASPIVTGTVIAGRADLVERVRRSPLFRALRVDKLAYAALSATLRSWVTGRPDDLPVPRMIRMSREEITARASAFAAKLRPLGLRAELRDGESVAGGGSAGSFFGVMGPSICSARSEVPAKTTSAIRDSIGTPRKKSTATPDIAGMDGASF